MPYPYLGDTALTYTQYLDADSGTTLTAQRGGAYLMTPAAGCHEMAVPPADGLWGPGTDALVRALTALDAFASAGSEDEAVAALNAVADAAMEAHAALGAADVNGPGVPPPPAAKTKRKAAQAAGQGG